ncbi:MAG: hypothetical protein KGS72_09210 [Cyanobacteria bacterium REEB67]|nr:hypothetical protein [Cyanobacteria bacterium REEB67]
MDMGDFAPMGIVFAGIIIMPVIIIKLAKMMKVVKEKKEAAAVTGEKQA